MNTYKNCTNTFKGKYCNSCGEKVIEAKDFAIKNILFQAIGFLTNLDSKLYRTLKMLFFQPGILSKKYVEGIRMPYMKPFQLFVFANVIFFIFLSEIDLFRTPSYLFFVKDFEGVNILKQVQNISIERDLTKIEIANLYDNKSSDLAKGLIILLVPFIALIGAMLHFKERLQFGKHVIFAVHYFAFVLFLSVIIGELIFLTYTGSFKWIFIIPITLLMVVYYVVGIKNFYQNTWFTASIKGILGVMLINMVIQLYRIGINFLALSMI